MGRGTGFYRRIAPLSRNSVKCRSPNGDHFLGVAGLNRCDDISSVDGSLEGVGTLNRKDVRDLTNIEQGCNARHNVLAVGCRRRQKIVVVSPKFGDQQTHVFR